MYNENVEWVGTAVGLTANFAGTTNPFSGTKTTDVSGFVANNAVYHSNAN